VLLRVEVGDDFPFLAGLTLLSRLRGPQILQGCVLTLTHERRPVRSDQQWQRARRQHDSIATDARSPLAVDCMHPILRPVIHWPQILSQGPYVCVDGGVHDIMYIYMHMPITLITRQRQINAHA